MHHFQDGEVATLPAETMGPAATAASSERAESPGPGSRLADLAATGVLPGVMRAFPLYVRLLRRLALREERRNVDDRLEHWRGRREEVLETGRRGYRRPLEALGLGPEAGGDVLIADIDQDGFLLSRTGPLDGAPTVTPGGFMPRQRFAVQVVGRDGVLAVRKDFRGDRAAFVRELSALHELAAAGCNVPAVLDFDVDALTLTVSYVVGAVLREELARRGAVLRDRDVDRSSSRRSRRGERNRVVEARRLLGTVVDAGFADRLFAELRKAHAAGYVLHDIKYGNIMIERDTGAPFLIDFDAAQRYPSVTPLTRRFLRDLDYARFNLHFDADALTHDRVRRLARRTPLASPVHLEGGLRFAGTCDVQAGYDRWRHVLEEHLAPLRAAQVLDLTADDGSNAVRMLHRGAARAVVVAADERTVEQTLFVRRLFEWADNDTYDLTCIRDDLRNVPRLGLGRFDLVTAFGSLDHLDPSEVAELVRRVSRIAPAMVVEHDRRLDAVATLRANGFAEVTGVAPNGSGRSLAIARI